MRKRIQDLFDCLDGWLRIPPPSLAVPCPTLTLCYPALPQPSLSALLTNPCLRVSPPVQGGMEAVRDIRQTWPHQHTKIIAVTADAFEDTRDSCIAVSRA
jgi:hypothetical protein